MKGTSMIYCKLRAAERNELYWQKKVFDCNLAYDNWNHAQMNG